MAADHQSCLSGKLLIHIDIKYHVHIGVLISRLDLPFTCIIRCNAVNILKSIQTFVIYFAIALVQKSVPYYLSISYASFTVLGTRTTDLWDVRKYTDFTLEKILSLCHKVSLTHKLKVGSSLILFATA